MANENDENIVYAVKLFGGKMAMCVNIDKCEYGSEDGRGGQWLN